MTVLLLGGGAEVFEAEVEAAGVLTWLRISPRRTSCCDGAMRDKRTASSGC